MRLSFLNSKRIFIYFTKDRDCTNVLGFYIYNCIVEWNLFLFLNFIYLNIYILYYYIVMKNIVGI